METQFLLMILCGSFVYANGQIGGDNNRLSFLSELARNNPGLPIRVAGSPSISTCPASDIFYESFFNNHKLGGTFAGTGLTFFDCLALCNSQNTCTGSDWEQTGTGNCYLFTTVETLVPDQCCIHTMKSCTSQQPTTTSVVTLPPTSTTPPTTTPVPSPTPPTTLPPPTPPPTLPPQTPGMTTTPSPAAVCASGYQAFPGEMQLSGYLESAVTADACRQLCDNHPACVAVDFNTEAPLGAGCFRHPQVIPGDVVTGTTCCTRYIKVTCQDKQCYEYVDLDLVPLEDPINPNFDLQLLFDVLNIRPGGGATFPTVSCPGACVVEEIADTSVLPFNPHNLTRRCETNTPPPGDKACTSSTDPRTGLTTTTCRCYGDICNAFGPTLQDSCVALYAFDGNAEDITVNNRDGSPFAVRFDATDAQKNFSADFQGDGSIGVLGFRNFNWGTLISFLERNPAFTICLWIKRTGRIGRQSLLNNGPVGRASIDLYTEPDPINANQFYIKADVTIGGTVYSVTSSQGQAVFDTWHFVALVITNSPLVPSAGAFYFVQLFVDDIIQATDPSTYAQTNVAASTTSQAIDPGVYGLRIGNQGTPAAGGVLIGGNTDFFVGNMDELYLFARGLIMSELWSVKAVSSTMGVFLP